MNYAQHHFSDTIVALATPPGVGAIGVIRLSGEGAFRVVQQAFSPKGASGKDLASQASHTLHFGRIVSAGGRILDEVLVSVFKAPHSYTGENIAEVSCHGSPYILQQILELFIEKGARLAKPGEFTLRAFLNGKMNLTQAEAVADLIASNSESAHTLAMRQMRGGFSHEIKKLREDLINFASLIELELDFSEEDVEFANREQLKLTVSKTQSLLRALIQSFKLGNVLKNGVPTVIAGRPNAGKSTLLNALLNEERAIVSPIAGTTRDTIEEVLNIEGIEFRLIDTAGLREAQDQIEALGVAKTLEKVRQAALLVYVFDVSETKLDEVLADVEGLAQEGVNLLVVCNKMDKSDGQKLGGNFPKGTPSEKLPPNLTGDAGKISPTQFIQISALEGLNISALKARLYESVISQKLNLESPIVTNARHFEALQKASESLDEVLLGLDSGVTSDFVAMDIRRAMGHLGEILGLVSTEDLLENIFSKFCIGK